MTTILLLIAAGSALGLAGCVAGFVRSEVRRYRAHKRRVGYLPVLTRPSDGRRDRR